MELGRQSITQRRSKYGRPCDSCSLRKVKCDKIMPCSRCIKYNLPCTNNRETKKRGPKTMRPKTINNINYMHSKTMNTNAADDSYFRGSDNTNKYFKPQITLAELFPCLQIYQTWYYEIWPVLSVAQLTSSISSKENSCMLDLNPGNIQSYTLCCALAGAIKEQIHFVSSYDEVINIPKSLKSVDFVGECLRARNYCDYRFNPTIDTILVSFFLHVYYTDVKSCSPPAILYLREAISIAEILGLHDETRYKDISRAEKHRLRNIYYMLLVTERFTCLDANLPVVLDANIPYASVIDDEYPLMGGFSEIVKIFALPDKSFFMNRFNSYALNNPRFSKQLVLEIQEELANIKIQDKTPDIQKLNILLSQNWMRSLVWNLCKTNKLITEDVFGKECLSNNFPIKVARELLDSTQNLPLFAFETNGPGVCTKLVEIAEGLSTIINEDNFAIGYDTLNSILNMISKLNDNIIVSTDIHKRMQNIMTNKRVMCLSNYNISNFDRGTPGLYDRMGFEMSPKIQMIDDNEEAESMENLGHATPRNQNSFEFGRQGLSKWSPISQLSMAFNFFPNSALSDIGTSNVPERNIFHDYSSAAIHFDSKNTVIARENNFNCEGLNKNYGLY